MGGNAAGLTGYYCHLTRMGSYLGLTITICFLKSDKSKMQSITNGQLHQVLFATSDQICKVAVVAHISSGVLLLTSWLIKCTWPWLLDMISKLE